MPKRDQYALTLDRFYGWYDVTVPGEDGRIRYLPLACQKGHINADHTIYSFLLEDALSSRALPPIH